MKTSTELISNNLAKILQERNLYWKDLIKLCGISREVVYAIKQKRGNLNTLTIDRLCEGLKIEHKELFV